MELLILFLDGGSHVHTAEKLTGQMRGIYEKLLDIQSRY